MKGKLRKVFAFTLALCLALSLAIGASAAGTYSVKVSGGAVSFLQNGYVTGSYQMADQDLALMVDSGGDLLVCFNNTSGNYVGVTLGSQRNLSLSGTLNTLTLNSSYTGTLTSSALTNTLRVNGGATVNLNNGVGVVEVAGSGTVNIGSGTTVNHAYLNSAAARLNVNAGAKATEVRAVARECVAGSGTVGSFTIGKGTSSTTVSTGSSELRLTTSTLYADYGDRLSDLTSELRSGVRAYDRSSGASVSGSVAWVSSSSTKLTRDGTYDFTFKPSSSRYKSVRGSVKIVVDGSSSSSSGKKVTFKTSTIYASYGDELRDLESDLEDNVRAYYDGTRIYGEVEWVSSRSTEVKKSKSYDFKFIPDSGKYDTTRGSIRVSVDDDDDDDDDDYYFEIDKDGIHADRGDRLRDLERELKNVVKAYDEDTDKRITGKFEWIKSDSTKVEDGEKYEFRFKPSKSKYDSKRDYVKIVFD